MQTQSRTRNSFSFVVLNLCSAFPAWYNGLMPDQITMLRTEVLHLLRQVLSIRTAIEEAECAVYADELDEVKVQLVNMRAELDTIVSYFETQHKIGMKQIK